MNASENAGRYAIGDEAVHAKTGRGSAWKAKALWVAVATFFVTPEP